MIRQNDKSDAFEQVRYGSVISYPAGKKHIYRDFLVLGKTDKAITTVPLRNESQTAKARYDVSLPDTLNETLGDNYFVSPLDAAVLGKSTYNQVNSVHLFDLAPEMIKPVDIISSKHIKLARVHFKNWQKIEQSNLSIAEKHQALKAGLAQHEILTANSLQKYLLSSHLHVPTSNETDHVSSYIDQTYHGSLLTPENEATEKYCQKYADVERLKKYDIIRYKAITGSFVKWRPFIVMGQNGQSVDLVPITHTLRGKLDGTKGHGLYSIYHINLSPEISQALNLMNGESREKAKEIRSAIAPCDQVTVPLNDFKKRQLPQYLGNLKDYVSLDKLHDLEDEKNQTIAQLMQSYDNFLTEKKAFGHVKHYQLKLIKRESINTKDLKALIKHEGSGKYAHKPNLYPIMDSQYLAQKEANELEYGIYQTIPKEINQKKAAVATTSAYEIEM